MIGSPPYINPFDGMLHQTPDEVTGAGTPIPQLDADPSPAKAEEAWVLRSGTSQGTPMGLLLALAFGDAIEPKYLFSYRTLENTTVRVELT